MTRNTHRVAQLLPVDHHPFVSKGKVAVNNHASQTSSSDAARTRCCGQGRFACGAPLLGMAGGLVVRGIGGSGSDVDFVGVEYLLSTTLRPAGSTWRKKQL